MFCLIRGCVLLTDRKATVGVVLLGLVLAYVILVPLLLTDASAATAMDALRQRFESPSVNFWFGTDGIGRDVFYLAAVAGQTSLLVALVGATLSTVLGLVVGVCAGYFGGWFGRLSMRLVDLLVAIPWLPLLMLLSLLQTAYGVTGWAAAASLVLMIALLSWTQTARLVRSEVLSLKHREFVMAAKAFGCRQSVIVRRHIVPNILGYSVLLLILETISFILLESALSFLGFGIQPPMVSWGTLLNEAQYALWQAPWLVSVPGVLIFMTAFALFLLNDAWQDRRNGSAL